MEKRSTFVHYWVHKINNFINKYGLKYHIINSMSNYEFILNVLTTKTHIINEQKQNKKEN